jgi:hypothetical protein
MFLVHRLRAGAGRLGTLKMLQMRKQEISAILRHGAAADERKTPALGVLPRSDIEVATLDALSFVR